MWKYFQIKVHHSDACITIGNLVPAAIMNTIVYPISPQSAPHTAKFCAYLIYFGRGNEGTFQ